MFKSDPLTGAFAWNADCLEGVPINFKESGEGSLWSLSASLRLSWDRPTSSSTLTGSLGRIGIGFKTWWCDVSAPFSSSTGAVFGCHIGKGRVKKAGKNSGIIGAIPPDPVTLSSDSLASSWGMASIGSNSELRERFNEGNGFAVSVSLAWAEGSNTCSSGTDGVSVDWQQ